MVKDKEWPNDGAIVVAVNLSNEESYHEKLNIKLIKETKISVIGLLKVHIYIS